MLVEVSGRDFVFHPTGACCGEVAKTAAPSTTSRQRGMLTVRSKRISWEVPYCFACAKHTKAVQTADFVMMDTGSISVGIGGVVFMISSYKFLGVSIALVGMFISLLITKYLTIRAKALCTDACTCTASASEYVGFFHDSAKLEVISPVYAVAFMKANRKKLVNVQPETWELLGAKERRPTVKRR
jgi:hypothetical protein